MSASHFAQFSWNDFRHLKPGILVKRICLTNYRSVYFGYQDESSWVLKSPFCQRIPFWNRERPSSYYEGRVSTIGYTWRKFQAVIGVSWRWQVQPVTPTVLSPSFQSVDLTSEMTLRLWQDDPRGFLLHYVPFLGGQAEIFLGFFSLWDI